jgi:hypothetical protein
MPPTIGGDRLHVELVTRYQHHESLAKQATYAPWIPHRGERAARAAISVPRYRRASRGSPLLGGDLRWPGAGLEGGRLFAQQSQAQMLTWEDRFGWFTANQLGPEPSAQPGESRSGFQQQVSVAEDRRFELLRGCPQHAFQVCGRLFTLGQDGL